MAFFGTPHSFVGLDIGTSSLKLVELVDRRKRIEVATYAQANLPNLLVDPAGDEEDAVRRVANVVSQMMDKAGVASDVVVAALPSGNVFSTVLNLPALEAGELDKAVHFAAKDVVPADLADMVLGWSRVGEQPHMDSEISAATPPAADGQAAATAAAVTAPATVPVFLTAAPKEVVHRYTRLTELLNVQLYALEVETFPLMRSLLDSPRDAALIADIGDKTTTLHVIDRGAPQVSHSIEYGGHTITAKIADDLGLSFAEAEAAKVRYGVSDDAPADIGRAAAAATMQIVTKAQDVLRVYQAQSKRQITKTVLIGGGANLRNLSIFWGKALAHSASVGNPWRGLSYSKDLEQRLVALGPTYAVAVGLALRGYRA